MPGRSPIRPLRKTPDLLPLPFLSAVALAKEERERIEVTDIVKLTIQRVDNMYP